MDKIWDIKSFEVVAGMKKPNDHAEPTKVECLKNKTKPVQYAISPNTRHQNI